MKLGQEAKSVYTLWDPVLNFPFWRGGAAVKYLSVRQCLGLPAKWSSDLLGL